MAAIMFGEHSVCRRCEGRRQIATREDTQRRSNELARIRRIEIRTGQLLDRPPFVKSDCPACDGKGYV